MKIRATCLLWLLRLVKCSRLRLDIVKRKDSCEAQIENFIDVCKAKRVGVNVCKDMVGQGPGKYVPSEGEYVGKLGAPDSRICTEPAFWTGGIDGAPGFEDFMRDNMQLCILHHGAASVKQAAVFGLAMDSADCLSECPKAFQNAVWARGSSSYAKHHVSKFTYFVTMQNANITEHIPVFIGQRFAKNRPGEQTVLFTFELGTLIDFGQKRQWAINGDSAYLKSAGQWDITNVRFDFMNFSPKSCDQLWAIQVAHPRGAYPLGKIFSDVDDEWHRDIPSAIRAKWRAVCSDCPVEDRVQGPTKSEIASCFKETRALKVTWR